MSQFLKNPIVWVCTVGFFLTLIVYYPGFMNYDASFQLNEFRTNTLSDLHPPLMAWLWGNLDRLYPGPFPFAIFQNLLFWVGIGLIFTGSRQKWGGLVVLGITFLPSVWAGLGTIQKDTLMASALVLAAGLLMASQRTGRKGWAWLALVPCFLAVGVRHNAITAIPPLLLWWAWLMIPKPRVWLAWSIGIAVTLFIYLGASTVNQRLTTNFIYPSQQFLMHDLIAISLDQNELLLPNYVSQFPVDPTWVPFTVEDLRPMYSYGMTTPIFIAQPPQVKTVLYITQQQFYDELIAKWREVVAGHPVSYLKHRAIVYAIMLGMNPGSVCSPYTYDHYGYSNPELEISYSPSPVYQALTPLFERLGQSLLFRSVIYIAGAVLLFCLAWWRKTVIQLPVMALTASAITYAVPLAFTTVTCAYRMSYWSVIATLIAGGLFLVYRGRNREI